MDGMSHIPIHVIDKYVAGLLGKQESVLLEEHVRTCTACDHKLAQALEDRAAFLRANPPEIRSRQLVEANRHPVHRPEFCVRGSGLHGGVPV